MKGSEVRERAFAMPMTSPVLGVHIIADLTLGIGKLVRGYLH